LNFGCHKNAKLKIYKKSAQILECADFFGEKGLIFTS